MGITHRGLTMNTAAVGDTWYRFEDVALAPPVDERGTPIGRSRLDVRVYEFHVEKVTPTGVRLCNGRFVSNLWTKQWASPTRDLAKAAFLARKRAQLRILEDRVLELKVMLSKW